MTPRREDRHQEAMAARQGALTLGEARQALSRRFAAAGIDTPDVDALLLLQALTGKSRSEVLLAAEQQLGEAEAQRLEAWAARRERREPLQQILGKAPFYGLELTVTPDVLVPRPETERLVELALAALAGRRRPRVLDVGTGSGAIALAIEHERPDAVVMATDLSPAALAVAAKNSEQLGLPLELVLSDLLAAPAVRSFAATADLIVSNPPYLPTADQASVPPEVRHEPAAALFAGEDGLAVFRRLERQAFELLPAGAQLLVELDPRNAAAALAGCRGWATGELLADLTGRKRFVRLVR